MDREFDLAEEIIRNLEGQAALPDFDIKQYSPLTLAYIGDCIYELVVRTKVVREANEAVNRLHRKASALVKAEAQSAMIGIFEERGILTEEEQRVYKRGRNAKAYTHAKNASIQEYRRATGFEAVFGYLYLKGDMERLLELAGIGLGAYCRTEKISKNTYIPEARNRTGSGKEQE
uniref:Mini-ribonuclease 3 n=1 Tax=Eubacterium cellulosolvens TaxID=29322 RepID=UPI000685282E|nr:ribonuclease III domain-containing protein [[Eubacterium] cellulosolvens]